MFSTGRATLDITSGKLFLRLDLQERWQVPTRRLSMRKVNEVLRLRFELGLEQRAIARACSISRSTVHEYLKRAAAAGIGWPLKESWSQRSQEPVLFPEQRLHQKPPEQVLAGITSLHKLL